VGWQELDKHIYHIVIKNLKGRGHLGDQSVDGHIVLTDHNPLSIQDEEHTCIVSNIQVSLTSFT
jgi:hypothetical protein